MPSNAFTNVSACSSVFRLSIPVVHGAGGQDKAVDCGEEGVSALAELALLLVLYQSVNGQTPLFQLRQHQSGELPGGADH
jgi:hypothetical protein